MIILPAIDLYEGKGVRLTQGDYSRMTVYLSDPVSAAKQMEADGAESGEAMQWTSDCSDPEPDASED